MRPHLRYLRYVVLHKLYVFAAGVAIGRTCVPNARGLRGVWWWIRWLLRLALHDLSKFRPSEWRPYVAKFYRSRIVGSGSLDGSGYNAQVERAFNIAWLQHIHRNEHHWQHWLLHEDSGKVLVLLPPPVICLEMVADWCGAGTKISRLPSLAECIGETIAWYAKNRTVIQLRDVPRQAVEGALLTLAQHYGLAAMAAEVQAAQAARVRVGIDQSIARTMPMTPDQLRT